MRTAAPEENLGGSRSPRAGTATIVATLAPATLPFIAFGLAYAFRTEYSITDQEAARAFAVSIALTALAVLIYRGPSVIPAAAATTSMIGFLALVEFVEFIGLHIGGPCGGDGGTPYALPGSPAARFCGRPAETLWGVGLLGALALIPAAYLISRRLTWRWPLALGIIAAGAAVGCLDSYSLSLPTSAG